MTSPPDVPPDDQAPPQPPHQPPPGWYDDPSAPGRPRWWDGSQWGPPSEPPPGGLVAGSAVPGIPGVTTRPTVDLDQERRSGGRARAFLIVGVLGQALSAVLSVIVFHDLSGWMGDVIDAASRNAEPPAPPIQTGGAALANGLSNLTALAYLVAGVMFLVWFYRSAVNAAALGLRARLGPIWAVLGFIIPVINFWFPCWVALDLFPRPHPARRRVIVWWLSWMGAQLLATAALVTTLFAGLEAGLVLAGVAVVVTIVAGVLGRAIVAAALDVHAELAAGHPGGRGPATSAPTAVVDPWARAAERQQDPWANR